MNLAFLIMLLVCATLFGAMLFFTIIVAPVIHARLPADTAARFLRAVFPRYYLFNGVLATAAVVSAWYLGWLEWILSVLVLAGFLVAGLYLVPAMNRAREQRKNDSGASMRFRVLHLRSMLLNLAQMLLLAFLLVRLAGN